MGKGQVTLKYWQHMPLISTDKVDHMFDTHWRKVWRRSEEPALCVLPARGSLLPAWGRGMWGLQRGIRKAPQEGRPERRRPLASCLRASDGWTPAGRWESRPPPAPAPPPTSLSACQPGSAHAVPRLPRPPAAPNNNINETYSLQMERLRILSHGLWATCQIDIRGPLYLSYSYLFLKVLVYLFAEKCNCRWERRVESLLHVCTFQIWAASEFDLFKIFHPLKSYRKCEVKLEYEQNKFSESWAMAKRLVKNTIFADFS